jgi:ribosomal peptide maturation radical SAM protein 1
MLERLIDQYQLDQAHIVGFTSMFAQNVACFAMARKLKEQVPQVVTVMGGANCEAPMGQEIARHLDAIDFVFSGPGLKSFPAFVQHFIDGELDACHRLSGVFSRTNTLFAQADDGIGVLGEELDIDTPVDLDYESFLEMVAANSSESPIEPILLFETSRGCWWGERSHCTFCGLNGLSMTYRSMPVDQAMTQFHNLFRYAPQAKVLECVDNIMPKHYPKEVFAHLEVPPEVSIFYEVKSDLSEEEMAILAQARVKMIQPGIESLSTGTLKLMRKGSSAFQNVNLLKLCAAYDIEPVWNLLMGFPGEGAEVYRKYVADIPLLLHLPPPTGAFPIRFDRFSPYFMQAQAYELDLHPLDYYELIYPFDETVLKNLAYFFMDRNITADYLMTMVEWIGPVRKAVGHWQQLWSKEAHACPPGLFFTANGCGTVVYDSRSGEAVEHEIGSVGRDVLDALARPSRYEALESKLLHVSASDLESAVSRLQELRLLFQEGDRLMSLVERFVNSHKVISVSCSSETGAVARTHRYGASPRTCNGLTKRSTSARRGAASIAGAGRACILMRV